MSLKTNRGKRPSARARNSVAQHRSARSMHAADQAVRRAASRRNRVRALVADLPRARMPHDIRPMLATLVDRPFDRTGWIFEPKWDGYRAIAEVSRAGVRLYSRNHKPFDAKYGALLAPLRALGHDAVLDGEIVVLDEQGRASFQLLQNYQRTGEGQLVYYVFDLLYLNGHDLRKLPLLERKEALGTILGATGPVRLSEHIEQNGVSFFDAATSLGLEGIVAKDGASLYVEGARGRDWLKIKTRLRQEAVIAGFTAPRGQRSHLGALILGVYEGDDLLYIGHTGGGLDEAQRAELLAKLKPLIRRTAPFRQPPKANAPVKWVEPRLVCEVVFQEWTDAGIARQPIFVGMRDDKPATDVRREKPVDAARAVNAGHAETPSV